MQKDARHEESVLSPEIQDVMKSLISAIRVVKIYPPNNPVYSQSLKKASEAMVNLLNSEGEFSIGVQKGHFTCRLTPFGQDGQVNKAIAQDLFAKGLREMTFRAEITEEELQLFCQTLALSPEELAMRSGISTILWEQGAAHIKVTEAGLDDVITTSSSDPESESDTADAAQKRKDRSFAGKTLVLGDVKTDPEGFGAGMIEYAFRTKAEYEAVEDRLLTLYRQAGKKILKDHGHESEELFDGLARSVLALESPHREALVAGKLYGEVDAEFSGDSPAEEQQIPNVLDEIRAGRFAGVWTIDQVATLLKKSAAKTGAPPAQPVLPARLEPAPLGQDLLQIAHSLDEETDEQREALSVISSAGMESDIIEAAVRTLVSLIPLAKNPRTTEATEKDIRLFSGVIRQLEEILSYLLKKNNYELATIIIKALHAPVDVAFQPRMRDALRKTATKPIIKETIEAMRLHVRSSREYQSAYSYLQSLDQKAIEVLLELLAEENDREKRIFVLDLLKDFGRNQTVLLGEYLSDDRWYVVRNIVNILGETGSDQAVLMLRKVVDHKNIQIRQEVIKVLLAIGGKKAGALLAKFLKDPDPALRLLAVRSFGEMPGLGAEESLPLLDFLRTQPLKRKEQEITLAAVRSLARVGGPEAALFLETYGRLRWWRSRKLQRERREAALKAVEEISGRHADGG